jgi:predicted HicB family RNase H-like nuclease
MALALTQRDITTSTSNVATYNGSGAITPGANALILVTVTNTKASAPDTPSSVVGYGITFTQIDEQTQHTVASPIQKVSVWRGVSASPTSAQLTVTFPASQTSCCIVVDEFSGVRTGGTNGSLAVGTPGHNAADSIAVGGALNVPALGAFESGSGVYVSAGSSTNNAAVDGKAGITQSRDSGIGTPTNGIFTGYSLTWSDTTPGIVIATATKNCGVIAFEVKVPSTATTVDVSTAGAITFTGQTVGMRLGLGLTAGAITFAGQLVAFRQTQNVVAGAITFTGQTITTTVATIASVSTAGQLTFTGQAVAFRQTQNVTGGAITFTGQSVGVVSALPVTAGAVTFTGGAVGLRQAQGVSAGAITFTGQPVGLSVGLGVTAGAITFTGQAVAFRQTQAVIAGSITFAGQTVSFGGATSVNVSTAGAITFTGQPTGLVVTVAATAGTITFTGQAVAFRVGIGSSAGAITFAGQTIGLKVSVGATAGAITFTGQAVGMRQAQSVIAGSITFTGGAITIGAGSVTIQTGAGLITFAGQTVGLAVISADVLIETFEGVHTGGAPAGGVLTLTGAQLAGGAPVTLELETVAGAVAGGAPAGTVLAESVEGPTAGGVASGAILIETQQG